MEYGRQPFITERVVLNGNADTQDPGITTNGRAVIWDLDGTLVDSLEAHIYAWQVTMAEHGFTMTREDFRLVNGKKMADALQVLLGSCHTMQELAEVELRKEARFRERLSKVGLRPMPGVVTWLEHLQAASWKQGIATSGPRENMHTMLTSVGLEAYFTALVCAEDVQKGKPDPEPLLRAASLLGVEPRLCITVDDAPPGLEAGRASSMRTIGVGPDFETLRADITVATLEDLQSDTFDALVPDSQQNNHRLK
jgi:HAD superfamily hydrolase (TIGR01509 family)